MLTTISSAASRAKLTAPRLARFAAAFALVACCQAASAQPARELQSPALDKSGQANLVTDRRGRVYLSWIDRTPDNLFTLRFSVREGAGWSRPRTIAEGRNWFVNWADFPSLFVLPDGSLAAHWLVKSGAGTYAYDVHMARSSDGGATWSKPTVPHRDATQTEHGFVSMFPAQGGRLLGAVWLDGREMKEDTSGGGHGHGHGDMTLRYAALGADGKPSDEALLDARVCECCQTSAAATRDGAVVVYRDRSPEEIRDIGVVRLVKGKWTPPRVLHADGWKIDACPVNGPSVASDGALRAAVAWYTAAGEKPLVRVAFSADQGETFSAPVTVSDGSPAGRVSVAMLADGSAVVSWLEIAGSGGEVRARRVWPAGKMSQPVKVAATGVARWNGFPRMALAGDALVFAWIAGRVLTAELPVAALAP
ncbi:MAG TPA: sialidase family protein [Pyrinomonadaceae bacterium]|nr:sialidase family protein [Pyrinomonadaceae bacterium]